MRTPAKAVKSLEQVLIRTQEKIIMHKILFLTLLSCAIFPDWPRAALQQSENILRNVTQVINVVQIHSTDELG